MKNKIVILDYSTGTVYVRAVPDDLRDKETDEVFEYFADKMNLSADECEWMHGTNIKIDITTS